MKITNFSSTKLTLIVISLFVANTSCLKGKEQNSITLKAPLHPLASTAIGIIFGYMKIENFPDSDVYNRCVKDTLIPANNNKLQELWEQIKTILVDNRAVERDIFINFEQDVGKSFNVENKLMTCADVMKRGCKDQSLTNTQEFQKSIQDLMSPFILYPVAKDATQDKKFITGFLSTHRDMGSNLIKKLNERS